MKRYIHYDNSGLVKSVTEVREDGEVHKRYSVTPCIIRGNAIFTL